MATLITKNSSTASSVPTNAQLVQGELAVNVTDKRLYTENASGTVVELGTNPGSAVTHTAGTAGAPAITTTGDTNTGIFFPAADTVAASVGGTEGLRLTSTGLGVGTSSPGAKLEVANTGGSVAARLRSSDSGYAELYFGDVSDGAASAISYEHSSNMLRLYNGGSARVYLDSSGNLGLGVTPSAWFSTIKALQIGSVGGAFISGNTVSGGSTNVGLNMYFDSVDATPRYGASSFASRYTQFNGQHQWYTAPSGTAGNTISFTQAMTLDASGNLGVGTTSPSNRFVVSNSGAAGVEINPSTGNIFTFNRSTLAYTDTTLTANNIIFQSGGASERARITSGGDLLVGTTTATEKLTVAGNISINTSGNPFLQIRTSGSGNNPYVRLQADTNYWDVQGTFSNAGDELYFNYNGNARAYINSATGAYTAVSDQRLKKDITDISYGLSAVMALRPVEYLMRDEPDDAQKHLGFIAQEALEVVPSSVSLMTGDTYGMDKTEIVAVLVKAIQELKAEFDAYKATHP